MSLLNSFFAKLTSIDRILNETLNEVTDGMIINADLNGSKLNPFSSV